MTNTNGTPITDLSGYTIDYGTSSSQLDQSISISSSSPTSYAVQSLPPGTWYFALTADASDGTQSSLSNVVSATVQ